MIKDKHLLRSRATESALATHSLGQSRGFSLLEMLVVVAIALIMMGMALPTINNTVTSMHLYSSASTIAGVIQSTRYKALSTGCPYTVAISAATRSYQIAAESVVTSPTAPPVCNTTYSNVPAGSPPVPFANSDVNINLDQTLVLNPSGTIAAVSNVNTPKQFTIILSIGTGGPTKTVTVSGVGNVSTQ